MGSVLRAGHVAHVRLPAARVAATLQPPSAPPADRWSSPAATRTLDAHACRLRKRLRAAEADRLVVNVRGVGYRLVDSVPTLGESGADDAANGPRPAVELSGGRRAA